VFESNRVFAREKNLFLRMDPAPPLLVEGDAGRVRRLIQNLVRNAVKYTEQGGVVVVWGEEKTGWWVSIKDTGPGLQDGSGASLLAEMEKATEIAAETDGKPAEASGQTERAVSTRTNSSPTKRVSNQPPGEGIGLSIVKRLCDLLDASLEVTSPAGEGTTFRVVFPRSYQPVLPPVK